MTRPGPRPAISRGLDALEDVTAAGLRALPDWRGKATIALRWNGWRGHGRALGGQWRLRMADGSTFCLPRSSQMAWSVAVTGYWDRHLIEHMVRYIEPGTLALDIGASLGLWAVPLGAAARSSGAWLWCFEPNPDNLSWLRANIDANDLSTVAEIHAYALGSCRGTARLGYRERGGGNAAVVPRALAEAVEVPVRPLDELDFPRRVSFVKMDIEGFELEVLRGARTLVARDRPTIFGEFNAAWLRMRGEDLAAELGFLAALGYDVFEIDERRSTLWRPRDQTRLRRLEPPFVSGRENLLLLPARPATRSQ